MTCTTRRWFGRSLLLSALALFACAAQAGNISFSLSSTGTNLTVVNTGDSVAFFPEVLALRADGSWQRLPPPAGQEGTTQIGPGQRLDLVWQEAAQPVGLEKLRPTMVRFFDQAGVGFGQISFFATPAEAGAVVAANYVRGELHISPPKGEAIAATWVLWPQEEGIAGILGAFHGFAAQPPARKIAWGADASVVRMATGDALPSVVLIHESAQGYRLQRVAGGWAAGRQQRAAWLDANRLFYALALALAATVAGAVFLRRWRRQP